MCLSRFLDATWILMGINVKAGYSTGVVLMIQVASLSSIGAVIRIDRTRTIGAVQEVAQFALDERHLQDKKME